MAEVYGLMCHCTQRKARERPVVGFVGEPDGLHEVALRKPVFRRIEAFPSGKPCDLRRGAEHRLPVVLACETSAKVAGDVRREVLDDGQAGVSASELLVRSTEHREHVTHRVDLASTDSGTPELRASSPVCDLLPRI